MGKHKWEPDIYLGFSLALHLQCGPHIRSSENMANASRARYVDHQI
jgi:hypothetical protein